MKIARLIYHIKSPCPKCPYTLGQVHTLTNPCPECKANGYQTYERFLRSKGTVSGSNPGVKTKGCKDTEFLQLIGRSLPKSVCRLDCR